MKIDLNVMVKKWLDNGRQQWRGEDVVVGRGGENRQPVFGQAGTIPTGVALAAAE